MIPTFESHYLDAFVLVRNSYHHPANSKLWILFELVTQELVQEYFWVLQGQSEGGLRYPHAGPRLTKISLETSTIFILFSII